MSKDNQRQHWLKELVRTRFEGSLKALSENARMDYTGLNLMVNGHRKISEKTVVKLCSRLGIEPPTADAELGKKKQGVEAPARVTASEAQLLAMIDRLLTTNEQLVTRLGTMEQIVQALERLAKHGERSEGSGPVTKTSAR